MEGELRFTGTPTGLIKWVLRVKDYADASLTQLALLDDNTEANSVSGFLPKLRSFPNAISTRVRFNGY